MSLIDKVLELCAYDDEQEWFEFKENWFQAEELGEYVSAQAVHVIWTTGNKSIIFAKGTLKWCAHIYFVLLCCTSCCVKGFCEGIM